MCGCAEITERSNEVPERPQPPIMIDGRLNLSSIFMPRPLRCTAPMVAVHHVQGHQQHEPNDTRRPDFESVPRASTIEPQRRACSPSRSPSFIASAITR